MSRLRALAMVLALLLGGPARPVAAAGEGAVLAKYYAWFDQNSWTSGKAGDLPAQLYVSSDRATIEWQVDQARAAGIDGFALDWLGPDNPTDTNLQTLLDVAKARGFKVTVDVDLNSPGMASAGDAQAALAYLQRYLGHPAWYRYGGRPVVSFFGTRRFGVNTWAGIRAAAGADALWIGEGDDFSYLRVFDGMHAYSVAWSPDPAAQLASYAGRVRAAGDKLWVATVMPGYDDTRLGRGNGFAVDRQGGAYYRRLWQGAIASQPAYVVITSWNEWLEGSQIEPSRAYGDLYLRLTRELGDSFRAAARAAAPAASGADGAFYTQAGQGRGGFRISDREGASFWSTFQALGGVDAIGFPASQRYRRDGFLYQATQGAVLQWRPELGRAVLANTFEWFSEAGKDDWLLETASVPKPIADDGSNGNWERARAVRLTWLSDDAIRQRYLTAGSLDRAIELYGLPTSRPERRGPFVVQRFQRVAFQRWVESVPGMPAPGSVVRILAGDLLKQAALVPPEAAQPSAS